MPKKNLLKKRAADIERALDGSKYYISEDRFNSRQKPDKMTDNRKVAKKSKGILQKNKAVSKKQRKRKLAGVVEVSGLDEKGRPKRKDDYGEIDVVHEIKKRRVPILVTISGVLILILVLVFLGIKINFALKDELHILLEPQDIYIYDSNKTGFILNFTIKNDNFFFCKSRCAYVLKDVSSGKVIDTGSIELDSSQLIRKDYDLRIGMKGKGQKTYVFETECSNIRSAICSTDESVRLKSSLVTVDYGLNLTEQALKAIANRSFTDKLEMIKDAKSEYLSNKDYIQRIGSPENLVRENDDALYLIKQDMLKAQEIRDIWDSQDYVMLSEELRDFLPSGASVRDRVLEYVSLYNFAYSLFNDMISDPMLPILQEYYARHDDSRVDDIIFTLNSMRKMDLYDFADDLKMINSSLADIKIEHNIESSRFFDATNILILQKKRLVENITNQTLPNMTDEIDCVLVRMIDSIIISHNADLSGISGNATGNAMQNTTGNVSEKYIDLLDLEYCAPFTKIIVDNTTLPLIAEKERQISSNYSTAIYEPSPTCCFDGECRDCADGLTPVIFIHGHLVNKENSPEVSLAAFAKMQHNMDSYINAGQLDIKSTTPWKRAIRPMAVRASYYYITYYDFGAYTISTQVTTGIENYAIRLKEIIDAVKRKTGSGKVDIVAHSMGGLVAREYIALFGQENIDRLIMIATPNKGVKGSIKDFCGILGSDKECQDLAADSIFIKRLNRIPEPSIEVYTIRASGCSMGGEDGDGIALSESVVLDYATNYEIKGRCTNLLGNDLHSNILDPDLYPETFELIMEILS